MKKDYRKTVFQIVLVLVITAGVISLAKSGYKMGQWLYIKTHSTH